MTKLNRRWWLLALLAGCVTEDMEEELQVSEGEQALYANTNKLWPTNVIPVCFEDGGHLPDVLHQVRMAVAASWEAEANVHFVGWGLCSNTPSTSGVRIRFASGAAHVLAIGRDLNNLPGGVVLNYYAWHGYGPSAPPGSPCREAGVSCLRSDAIRMFGHVLGFAKETDRADAPAGCAASSGSGNWPIGEWDPHSIMNPCNPGRPFNVTLSATDIRGVQKFYGSHRPIGVASSAPGTFEVASRTRAEDVAQVASVSTASSLKVNEGVIVGTPAVVAASPMESVALVRGTDGSLYSKLSINGVWTNGWESLNAAIVASPIAIKRATGIVDAFVRGTDGRLFRKIYANGYGWGPTEVVGASTIPRIIGTPAALAFGPHRVDVVVRGEDSRLYTTRWDGVTWTWSAWTPLNTGTSTVLSDPVLFSRDGSTLEIAVRGTDDAVYLASRSASGVVSGWSSVGAERILGVPAVVTQGNNRIDLFVRGTDNALYQRSFDGVWQPQYHQLGGNQITSSPVAVGSGGGRIDVFVRGTDDRAYVKRTLGVNWQEYQLVTALAPLR